MGTGVRLRCPPGIFPNNIYWSSDDDEDDNDHQDDDDEDGSWEIFQEDSGAGHQWHTQSPTHQNSTHGDGEEGDEEGWRKPREGRGAQQWKHNTTHPTQTA